MGGSPWYKLFIVFVLVILGTIVSVLLAGAAIPFLFDIPFSDIPALLEDPNYFGRLEIMKFLQGVSSIGTFMVPGIIGAYLISPYPSDYLNLNHFPKYGWLIIILILILTLSGTVISDSLYRLSSQLSFPDSLSGIQNYFDEVQQATEDQLSRFLNMTNSWDFIQMLLVMAVLPAVSEETLFRGVLQPLFIRGFKNVHIGIIITSVLFGMLHQQIYSFLSITALSIVLGYLKQWSKSIWVPVVMHFFNNASIVVAIYFFDMSAETLGDVSADWDYGLVIGGLALFGITLVILKRLVTTRWHS